MICLLGSNCLRHMLSSNLEIIGEIAISLVITKIVGPKFKRNEVD